MLSRERQEGEPHLSCPPVSQDETSILNLPTLTQWREDG